MNKLIVPAVAVVVVAALGGGGYYLYGRNSDPMKRAQEMLAKGDLRGAQIEFRNVVRQNPDNPEGHLRLGLTQMQMGDPVAGEKELKTARDLGADRWVVIPQLGQVYLSQGRFKDVLIEVPPEGPKPEIAARNLMLRAMAQVALNDIDAARLTLNAAEKIAPGNEEVLMTAARLAIALKDYPTAEGKIDQALEKDANSVEALLMKSQVLIAKGDKVGAMAIADRLVAAQPSAAGPRLDRANQAILAGDDKKAQDDINSVLAGQPRNAGATYMNAVLMVRGGKYADASTEFQKLGPVIARFPRALYFQSLVAANLGQTAVAVDFADHYVAKVPGDPDGVRLLARTQLTAGRPERAIEVLQKAVDGGQNDSQTLDLLGRAYALVGKGTDATKTLQQASSLAPQDANILTHLASSQLQQGDATAAQATLEKSVQLAPNQASSGEALVAAALSAGDLDGAQAALERLRAQIGDTESVGILSGMLRLGRLDLEGGRAAFANTVKQYPDSLNAKLNLAKVLILQGRRPEGEGLLKEILAKEPANGPTLNTLIQLLIAESQFPAAITAVEAARAAAPNNPAFTAVLSDLIVRSGDPRRAVGMLQAIKDAGDLPPVLMGALARAQVAAGLNEEAKKTYRDILVAAPADLDARRGQVDLLLRLKETDAAREALLATLAISPGNIGVMSALVTLSSQNGGLDAALKTASEMRNNPANLPNSTVLKGDALMQATRYGDAAQAFQDEFKLAASGALAMRLANAQVSAGRDDDATRTLRDWLSKFPEDADGAQMLALLDIKGKRYPDAEKNLQIVLGKRPGDTVALNNMAWLLGLKNDPRARPLAQRAYLQSPSPETADTLGWIMVRQGDAKGGLSLLQQASTQRPTDSTIKYHLAVALNNNGQKEDSVKMLQPLVAGPAFEEKAAAGKLLDELVAKK